MEITKQYSRKRRKLSIGDRLSELPDSLLTHILSLLPTTKISVRTSVLAKRWRHLWAYVPTLVFDLEDQEFIGRVISLHKVQSLNTLRLTNCADICTFDSVHHPETWLTAAIDRNVQNLDISSFPHDVIFPARLLTCKTLVDFRIDFSYTFPIDAGVVFWPRLKKLHVGDPECDYDFKFLDHLHSICPVLEELIIERWSGLSCNISSPTLESLTLNLRGLPNRVVINTPALVYLEIFDGWSEHIESVGPLNSLSEADICLHIHYSPYSVPEFLNRLCNVKCLKLHLKYSVGIIDSIAWTARFHNLTELELTSDSRVLLKFLEKADNLESLQFGQPKRCWIVPPAQVPTCLLSRLRTIYLVSFRGKEDEFQCIRYMLRNAPVLERMEIELLNPRVDPQKKFSMLQEISLFQRGSKACEVVFDSTRFSDDDDSVASSSSDV